MSTNKIYNNSHRLSQYHKTFYKVNEEKFITEDFQVNTKYLLKVISISCKNLYDNVLIDYPVNLRLTDFSTTEIDMFLSQFPDIYVRKVKNKLIVSSFKQHSIKKLAQWLNTGDYLNRVLFKIPLDTWMTVPVHPLTLPDRYVFGIKTINDDLVFTYCFFTTETLKDLLKVSINTINNQVKELGGNIITRIMKNVRAYRYEFDDMYKLQQFCLWTESVTDLYSLKGEY